MPVLRWNSPSMIDGVAVGAPDREPLHRHRDPFRIDAGRHEHEITGLRDVDGAPGWWVRPPAPGSRPSPSPAGRWPVRSESPHAPTPASTAPNRIMASSARVTTVYRADLRKVAGFARYLLLASNKLAGTRASAFSPVAKLGVDPRTSRSTSHRPRML